MKNVYVLGAFSTPIRKWPEKSHRDLVREAYLGVLKDAGMDNGDVIQSIWSGNAMLPSWGQNMIRGQVCLPPLVREGLLPERLPFFNVEGGCATASLAFQGAWRDVAAGAAAALLCSEEFYNNLPAGPVKDRCVKVAACCLTSGKYRRPDEPSLSRVAADQAYAAAGIGPEDIDVAEVHDAVVFGEIFQEEMLRFCPEGQGGRLVESGETGIHGRIPINTSGGLIAKGHPIGATGLSMISELTTQLRGEAGERQVRDPEFAIQENGGGIVGLEEAACSVVILQRV